MSKLMKRFPALMGFLLIALMAMAGQAWALGGPIVLSGDDADDGGHCENSRCGQLYGKTLSFIVNNSQSGGTGILAIGVNSGRALTTFNSWNNPANGGPGVAVTHARTAAEIANADFSNFAMIYMPSDYRNTSGGINGSQVSSVNARQADIVDFVNNLGGGLLSLTQAGLSNRYGWLPIQLTNQNSTHQTEIFPTPDMEIIAAGAGGLSHCCYHTIFTGPAGFSGLKVLAYHDHNGNRQFDGEGTDHVLILGGVQVTIQGNISLDPPTATLTTGDPHTVTATAEDGNPLAPVAGATVTFTVGGANAGASGTCNNAGCTTDANGQVSFTYTGNNEGTDNIAASFVDGNGDTQTSNTVEAIWEAPPNLPPVADAGADQTVEQQGPGGSSVTLDGSGSSDPDGDPLTYTWTGPFGTTSGVSPTVTIPPGTHTVTLVVNDGTVDSAPDTVIINVVDTTPPSITAPANVTTCNDPGQSTAVVTLPDPTASDNSGSVSVQQTGGLPNGSAFPIGTKIITWTATDSSGNQATATTTVTVNDCEAPVITTQNLTVEATGPLTPVNILAVTSAADNVGVVSGPTASDNGPFPLGSTTVNWTACDAAGNCASASQIVTVVDTTPPSITAPADVTTCNNPGQSSAVVTLPAPTASDNSGSVSVQQTGGLPNGSAFPVGTTVITWTATDSSGNQAIASTTVTVDDCEKPVITTQNLTVEATGPLTPVDIASVTSATDNVGVVSGPTADNNGPFPLGSTTVNWTACDAAGNCASAVQIVTVEDTTAPDLTNACVTDKLWPPNHKLVLVAEGSATDAFGATVSVNVTSNQPLNGTGDGNTDSDWATIVNGDGSYSVKLRAERAGNIGQRDYSVTITATDGNGNTSTATCAASVPHDQGNNNSPASKKKK